MDQNLTTFPFPSGRRIWWALHPSTTLYMKGLTQDDIDSPALFHNYSLKGPGPSRYSMQHHISPFYQWHSINPRSAGGTKDVGPLWWHIHSKGWGIRPLKIWVSSVPRYSLVSPSEVGWPFCLILFSALPCSSHSVHSPVMSLHDLSLTESVSLKVNPKHLHVCEWCLIYTF